VSNAAYNGWIIGPKSRALIPSVVYRASTETSFRGPACAEEVAISWATMDDRWRSQAGEIEYEDHPRSVAAPRILWRGSPPPARSSCGSSAAMMVGASPGIYNEPPSRFVRQVDDAEVKRRTLRGESQHRIAAALGVSRAQVCSARRRIKQAHGTSFSVHTGSKTSKYE
jgi:anti-sigma factor RsiW